MMAPANPWDLLPSSSPAAADLDLWGWPVRGMRDGQQEVCSLSGNIFFPNTLCPSKGSLHLKPMKLQCFHDTSSIAICHFEFKA